jgi:hypothetical protein
MMMAQNTIAKFISSQQTDSSEIRERIISLGKALVEELGLEPGVDTLARWMAHYVAEQITIAENATGDEKSVAEQRCFETILNLWQHRSSLPTGHRPLESFEPIFRALDQLDPDNSRPFFYSPPQYDLALEIDRIARILINFALSQAALNAVDEKSSSWLKNATDLINSGDLSVVVRLLPPDMDDQGEANFERIWQAHEKDLRSKIEKLDTFTELSSFIRAALISELEEISKEDFNKDVINDSS